MILNEIMKKPNHLVKAFFILLFFLSGLFAQESQQVIVFTLEKAIALALEKNRDVLIANQERIKADAQVNEAWSGALPQINITGQYMRNIQKPVLFMPPNTPFNKTDKTQTFELGSDNAYAMNAQLFQPLYNRKVGVALQIAKTYREYSDQNYQATGQSVALSVKKAFYAVLLAQKLLEANIQALDVVKANYENIQALYRHGNAAEYDLLRAEVQVANTEPLRISAENNLALAKNTLKINLALPLEQSIDVQGGFEFEEIPRQLLDETSQNALSTNPSIRLLSLQESILKKNISIERANNFPSLSLFGSYQWQSQENTFKFQHYLWANTINVGLQISYPLFDGFRTSSRVQQAFVEREKIHFLRLKAEEGLRIQIQSAELKMAEAKKRIAGQEKNIEQAQKAVRIAQTRFKSGVGTQLELMDTQAAMTRAQTNYAQAIFDYLVARADWEYAVGIKPDYN